MLPSRRFVSTASITVPSKTRWIGPVDVRGPVYAGVTLALGTLVVVGVVVVPPPGAMAAGAVVVDAGALGAYRAVARTTALATSSMLGRAGGPSPVALPRDACGAKPGDVASWCPSGRRLITTLLANRLSYSRRLRSPWSGSAVPAAAGGS